MTKPHERPPTIGNPIVSYYSPWRTDIWTCACGWKGTGDEADSEPFDQLLQVDCPQCFHRLCLVNYATEAEVRKAAAAGNEEARWDLTDQKKRAKRERKFKKSELSSAASLPALTDEKTIDLMLTLNKRDGDTVLMLEANGHLIHSELAWWESNDALERIGRHCATRYGSRIGTFTIGSGASIFMAGDSIWLRSQQARILEGLGLKVIEENEWTAT